MQRSLSFTLNPYFTEIIKFSTLNSIEMISTRVVVVLGGGSEHPFHKSVVSSALLDIQIGRSQIYHTNERLSLSVIAAISMNGIEGF